MKKGDILYVRTEQAVEGVQLSKEDFMEHIQYLEEVAKERYLVAGGFKNSSTGMIIFSAKNIEEAKKISDADPFVKRKLFTCDIKEWEVALLSKEKPNE